MKYTINTQDVDRFILEKSWSMKSTRHGPAVVRTALQAFEHQIKQIDRTAHSVWS